jgi:hypothetical protein
LLRSHHLANRTQEIGYRQYLVFAAARSKKYNFVISNNFITFALLNCKLEFLMNTIRKLPIGIQDFEKLRSKNYLYVDKTQYVYQLTQSDCPYFLGRPRRFGKSLFLSTLKAFFEGKKELFEGLKIAELEKEWTQYPVFYLDFNRDSYVDLENFNAVLDKNLRQLEKVWGKDKADTTPAILFSGLIQRACEKSGKQVVVLIDEYDKPLISTMDNPTLNEDIRKILKGFYGVLKAEDACLRFVFLTGVTKFSQVSVFSDLNQLVDISLDNKYSSICGISEVELLQNFQPEIQALAEANNLTYEEAFAKLKKLYDGYHFAKVSEDIYNPFSVLKTFGHLDFSYYWFATGTPTFLTKIMKNTGFDIQTLENAVTISTKSIMDYRADNSSLIPLLYQSGYLTIKDFSERYDDFILGFPNEEVKYGFYSELLPTFLSKPDYADTFSASHFTRTLESGDTEKFMQTLKAFYTSIPYSIEKKERKDEKYYQFIFYLLFKLMGQFVETEVENNKGRADAVVKTADSIYVFEFKMDDNATAEDALAQINSKDYAIPYSTDGRKLVKIGVEFSQREKGIKRWLIE